MSQPPNQTTGQQRGNKSGNVKQWFPIRSGDTIDVVGRMNWLGWMTNLVLNAKVQPGAEDALFVSDANLIIQYKAQADTLDASGTTTAGGGGGGGGGGAGNMNFVGAWSGGGSYPVDDVVTHTSNGMLGAFVRISGTGAGVEPFTAGWATDWTMIGRRFEDTLTIYKAATEKIVFDADAGTQVITQGSNVITLDAVNQQIKISDGTNIITLDTAADEIRITDGSTFTQIKKDLINQQNSGGTVKFQWDGTTNEKLRVDFSDGGSVEMTKAACATRDLTIREIDVCDSGVAKKMLILASAVYV
jgi:hypothetical protein